MARALPHYPFVWETDGQRDGDMWPSLCLSLLVGRGQSESVAGRGRRQLPLPVPLCGEDGGTPSGMIRWTSSVGKGLLE